MMPPSVGRTCGSVVVCANASDASHSRPTLTAPMIARERSTLDSDVMKLLWLKVRFTRFAKRVPRPDRPLASDYQGVHMKRTRALPCQKRWNPMCDSGRCLFAEERLVRHGN